MRLALLAALPIAACAASNGPTLYTGKLVPAGGTCDPPSTATLQLHGDAAMFVPNAGTLILHGTMDTNGRVTASLALPGADRKSYSLAFEARRSGPDARADIQGRYRTPRCTYTITLHPTDD